MHSGSSLTTNNPAFSISIGIASLILEGRALSEDEFTVEIEEHMGFSAATTATSTQAIASADHNYQQHNVHHHHHHHQHPPQLQQQPQQSQQHHHRPATNHPNDIEHIQRLRQKLLQIRSSPGPSRTDNTAVEQSISIVSGGPSTTTSYDSDEELETIYNQQQKLHEGIILNSLQALAATTCLKTTPRSFNKTHGLLKTVEAWTTASGSIASTISKPPEFPMSQLLLPPAENVTKKAMDKGATKQFGPHCEQFMKKIGLLKEKKVIAAGLGGCSSSAAADAAVDFDEHYCSARNESCLRWQTHYKQLIAVYSRGDPICIEVYLGPENHVILLEQWIIQLCEGSSNVTMTAQSLCSAIRSQLYFSQITAWTDLLKSTPLYKQPELLKNPRIKQNNLHKPKLNILYRIRAYDTTSCFNNKPNIHNFPDTKVSDTMAVKVCLKTLPRLNAIPKLQNEVQMLDNAAAMMLVVGCNNAESNIQSVVDDRLNHPCTEKGKHRCVFDEESVTDEMDETIATTTAASLSTTSHRDRQLLKYKKRLQKRDKKKKNDEAMTSSSSSSSCDQFIYQQYLCGFPFDQPVTEQQTSINSIRPPLYSNNLLTTNNNNNNIPSSSTSSEASSSHSSIAESSTSILAMLITKATQTAKIEVKSVATQTDRAGGGLNDMAIMTTTVEPPRLFPNCNYCGIEMQYLCWNCDNKIFTPQQTSYIIPPSDSTSANRLDKANLLLQAIHRTPSFKQNAAILKKKQQQSQLRNKSLVQDEGRCSAAAEGEKSVILSNARKSTCDRNFLGASSLDLSDCRLCKRQKTVHNYFNSNQLNNSNLVNNNLLSSLVHNKENEEQLTIVNQLQLQQSPPPQQYHDNISNDFLTGYRRTMSESATTTTTTACDHGIDFSPTTSPSSSLSSSATKASATIVSSTKQPHRINLTDAELKMYRRAYSDDALTCGCDDEQNNTTTNRPPTTAAAVKQKTTKYYQHQLDVDGCKTNQSKLLELPISREQFKTPTSTKHLSPTNYKTNPLYVTCMEDVPSSSSADYFLMKQSKGMVGRHIPKVNLTKIFNISPNNNNNADEDQPTVTDDIFTSSPTFGSCSSANYAFNFDNIHLSATSLNGTSEECAGSSSSTTTASSSILNSVHKSYSAPTFNHSSPALSPRFLKSAAIMRRRSRHLSDRSSERSSIGSDELFSDEEFGYGLDNTYSPVISPTKTASVSRLFGKSYTFGRRALLGSLEESLLQRCFKPKFHVPGFKVLLGASGGFCPSQQTIPSSTAFYELNGQSLSTPYVSEIRMPRKGYTIPRTGTVQATLLNPLGMVVRMFVVPYDFRDMPNMSQTFIRQRILAFDETANPGRQIKELSACEQMKLLRYAIHLRFQTSRSGRLALHTDIRMLISRRTDCDTAAAHAKGALESPNELKIVTVVPENPKFSLRIDKI